MIKNLQLLTATKHGQSKGWRGCAHADCSVHEQGCELSVDNHEVGNKCGRSGGHQQTDYQQEALASG